MKTILPTILILSQLAGCASSVTSVKPLAPDNQITSMFKFNFITKKNVDVIVVSVAADKTIVESVNSRERFELEGKYGKVGDRFVIRY